MDLVLTNGVARFTGKKTGVETGDPESFSTFDEFMDAYMKQFDYQMKIALELSINVEFTFKPDLVPLPLDAALMDGCVEKGKEVYHGGAKYT